MSRKISQLFLHQFCLSTIFLTALCFSLQTDTINSSSSGIIRDGDTIVSRSNKFKLGFFSPPNTTHRYLGISYTLPEQTVIWVANRDTPLQDSSGAAALSLDGNLVITDTATNQTVWSTNAAAAAASSPTNTTLQITDTGNLIITNSSSGIKIWESFLHPSDVFVPTMSTSDNIYTGKKVMLSAWENDTDPRRGSFTAGLDASHLPQNYIWRRDGQPHWRSGPWNGLVFIGIQSSYFSFLDGFVDVTNDSAGTFYYTMPEWKIVNRVTLNSSGSLVETMWDLKSKRWIPLWAAPENECDVYATCGPFGSCNVEDSPVCSCVEGFEPASVEEWARGNWSRGCRRRRKLECGGGDGFSRMQFVKVPDLAQHFYSERIDECRRYCLGNCSCIAYAHDSNIGCMFWRDTLVDVQKFKGVGVDLYIRLSVSELGNHREKWLFIVILPVVGFVVVAVSMFIAWYMLVKRKGDKIQDRSVAEAGHTISSLSPAISSIDASVGKVDMGELPLFTFEIIANATKHFHVTNLIGRGGFGHVYKGTLPNGQEIAVKRLSVDSGQGMQEFTSEVIVISKLQHRNLVRLLGGCVEKQEKILVYEYMPNKSLDVCLFDPISPTKNVLDWRRRFSIIEGIGRGLLYLHKDSRFRIIHRDLKPSNVLLDQEWNPKISDFGMARIFGGNQDHHDTARVVGTYGYMAPEYALEGRFSEKSDVYSFGVLMLEIIKGEKNTHYYNEDWSVGLLGSAWKMWSEDNGLGFVDESMEISGLEKEIVRCMQIGLLCVQEYPQERPSVDTAVSMLSREIAELSTPNRPIFSQKHSAFTTQLGCFTTTNDLTVTELDGR
ncbi:non-specific serine/threonine protein kinase [Salvia divinorum]|uniref:Receptor-like serine/threonine-protein kinase n=1 Tax=Salvia divinorum TaxID=28513 RepID=A0ABD1G101_SALDI